MWLVFASPPEQGLYTSKLSGCRNAQVYQVSLSWMRCCDAQELRFKSTLPWLPVSRPVSSEGAAPIKHTPFSALEPEPSEASKARVVTTFYTNLSFQLLSTSHGFQLLHGHLFSNFYPCHFLHHLFQNKQIKAAKQTEKWSKNKTIC